MNSNPDSGAGVLADMVLVRYNGSPRVVVARSDYFGLASADLVGPPRRFFSDGAQPPPLWEQSVDARRIEGMPSPATALGYTPAAGYLAASGNALRRLQAFFLVAEDPQGRFIARGAATLAHQASLVQHILENADLDRVLVADEVGLGKTIEAGLLISALLEQRPSLRVLYLAPARLVSNVCNEMLTKLGLPFRRWATGEAGSADLELDQLVVASIHRAVFPSHREMFAASGPWDMLVVDECHHLTAHGAGARSANEHFRLVRGMIARMPPEGRVVLLSGTPHQGNTQRFENLIQLLERPEEAASTKPGRVIFRTKDDVRDWQGLPLFPGRHVRPPCVVSLGADYRAWYDGIASLYDSTSGSTARRRAAGWARGQALQWAASSVEAGLGFLCRLAIRRLDWMPEQPDLAKAMTALRPYKGGLADDSVEVIHERMTREIERQRQNADVSDLEEEDDDDRWRPDLGVLARLLKQGTALVGGPSAVAKWAPLLNLLAESPREKFVLFAQPVETVSALVRLLRRELRIEPALIVGGQSDTERETAIRSFWRSDGPRLLVSSSAGGEGINLQVSRRLVHLDVPWNPMEMEQRVGRVHRFGSRETVLVDTIVVEGTREVDAYRYARQKLRVAFGDLAADPDRFETLYSRVMSLVPPEQFEDILGDADSPQGLGLSTESRLGALIEEGFRRWSDFHTRFSQQASRIRAAEAGAAEWRDLADFAKAEVGATELTGFRLQGFRKEAGGVVAVSTTIPTLRVGDKAFTVTDTGGVPIMDASGNVAGPLGVNVTVVAAGLRNAALDHSSTAAWLRPPAGCSSVFDARLPDGLRRPVGVLALVQQRLRIGRGLVFEQGTDMCMFLVDQTGRHTELVGEAMASLQRALQECVRQRAPEHDEQLVLVMRQLEADKVLSLGRAASLEEFASGIRHAVWPVFAAVVQ